MKDIRPKLELNFQLVRFYKQKKTGNLKLSKSPIKSIDISPGYTSYCRETIVDYIGTAVRDLTDNERVKSNPYFLIPMACVKDKTGYKGLNGTMNLTITDIGGLKVLREKKDIELVKNMLNFIVGIIGVCLSNGDDEKRRRSLGKGLAKDISIKGDNSVKIKYNVLSPFWLTSPILASLFLGLARNSISAVASLTKKELDTLVFNKISVKEIERIINETDEKKAREVYYDIIIPYFTNLQRRGCNYLLACDGHRKSIKQLIDNGYNDVFRSQKLVKYWERYGRYYGFSRFSAYLNNPGSVRGYDNYR